jgi:hypothetical protein
MGKADNKLNGAIDLGTLGSAPLSKKGIVNKNDRDNLYRFKLGDRNIVSLDFPAVKGASYEIYAVKGVWGNVLKNIGSLDFRKLRGGKLGSNLQRVSAGEMAAGDYVIRVLHRSGKARYRMQVAAQAVEVKTVVPVVLPPVTNPTVSTGSTVSPGTTTPRKQQPANAKVGEEFRPFGRVSLSVDTSIEDTDPNPSRGRFRNAAFLRSESSLLSDGLADLIALKVKGKTEYRLQFLSNERTVYIGYRIDSDDNAALNSLDFLRQALLNRTATVLSDFYGGTSGDWTSSDFEWGEYSKSSVDPFLYVDPNTVEYVLPADASVRNVVGDDRDNTIIGNNEGNALWGLRGNDTLQGKDGSDRIEGGEGNDRIEGGEGNDQLYGSRIDYSGEEKGSDTLSGGSGDDALQGQSGDDILNGGSGNDELYGDNAYNVLNEGDDTLNGDSGDDKLYGNNGNDSLNGGSGDDVLSGDDGIDRLIGFGSVGLDASEYDVLSGGGGHDRFVLGNSSTSFYVESGDGYAIITDYFRDYSRSEGDAIEVYGGRGRYSLNFVSVKGRDNYDIGSSATDTEIYYSPNTSGSDRGDRIAVVSDYLLSNVADLRVSPDFVFV